MLELSTDPTVNNFEERRSGEPDPFPEWEWPNADIKNITHLLKSIKEFAEVNHDVESTKQ